MTLIQDAQNAVERADAEIEKIGGAIAAQAKADYLLAKAHVLALIGDPKAKEVLDEAQAVIDDIDHLIGDAAAALHLKVAAVLAHLAKPARKPAARKAAKKPAAKK